MDRFPWCATSEYLKGWRYLAFGLPYDVWIFEHLLELSGIAWRLHATLAKFQGKHMEHRYCKTDAGRDEIHHPRRSLPRPVRILLLLLDEKHTGEGWVQLVHGAKMEDLETLLQAGLIVQTCVPASQTAVRQDRPLADAVAQLSYDQLYELLTSQARDRLGLLRGYRFVLEIERCTCIDELQELMVKFLSLVRDHQGAAEARQLSIALCSAGV